MCLSSPYPQVRALPWQKPTVHLIIPNKAMKHKFGEEPIGLPVHAGFGFLELNIGDELGSQGSYTIVRKLGYGMYSTVWLAWDKRYAAKFIIIDYSS